MIDLDYLITKNALEIVKDTLSKSILNYKNQQITIQNLLSLMSKKENKNYHKFLYISIIRPIFHPSKFLFDVSHALNSTVQFLNLDNYQSISVQNTRFENPSISAGNTRVSILLGGIASTNQTNPRSNHHPE